MTNWSGDTVRKARATMRARLPLPCYHCQRVVTTDMNWVVEHVIPRALGGSTTDPSNWWVSHRRCSDKSGTQVRLARRTAAEPTPRRLEKETPTW